MKRRWIIGAVCAPVGLFAAAGSADAGVVNSWQRSTDWVPGTTQGSTEGNPGPVGGTPVWQYEVAHGGGLGSSNPWYAQPTQLMTWDAGWWQTGWGVWSKGDDVSPPILAGRLVHNVYPTTFDDIPMVRWMSPLGNNAHVSVTGTLTVNWNGVNGLGRPVDVDVVIAKHTAAGVTSLLFSDTVSKPNPFPSVGDSVMLPVNLTNILFNAGDSLVISERGHNAVGPLGAWVNLYDSVRIAPAPGVTAVLGLAGLAAVRRRRK
jgi:MYXO-CTERM domain-containing protein